MRTKRRQIKDLEVRGQSGGGTLSRAAAASTVSPFVGALKAASELRECVTLAWVSEGVRGEKPSTFSAALREAEL